MKKPTLEERYVVLAEFFNEKLLDLPVRYDMGHEKHSSLISTVNRYLSLLDLATQDKSKTKPLKSAPCRSYINNLQRIHDHLIINYFND